MALETRGSAVSDGSHHNTKSDEQIYKGKGNGKRGPLQSPAQMLHFCRDDGQLFPEILMNSEASSCSGGGSGGSNDSSFAFTTDPALSTLLDMQPLLDPEVFPTQPIIASSISYPSPPQPPSVFPVLTDAIANGYCTYSPEFMVPLTGMGSTQQSSSSSSVYEEEGLSSYVGMAPSGSYSYLFPGISNVGSTESRVSMEYQRVEDGGVVGIYGSDYLRLIYGSNELQKVVGDNQQLMGGCGSPTPLAPSDRSSLDESNFKVGHISMEERKEKIQRYMKKRNERNFSKTIKYLCRRTIADSQPRVSGGGLQRKMRAERRQGPAQAIMNRMTMKM